MSQKETIIVAGGAGFIGSNFIRMFSEKHPDFFIVNFDKLTYSGNLENLKDISKKKHYEFIKGDIPHKKSVEAVIKKYKPAFIINFAAETHVDRSVHGNTEDFVETNIKGVFNLLEIAKNSPLIKKIVQVSTDEVYGALPLETQTRFTEASTLAPNSPYAATKAAGDLLCRAYHATWGVPVVVTRSSNNYGPYQYPEKLIPFFILRMLGGKTLPLYGDGKYVRDWVHVSDHVLALELCLLNGTPGTVYNIGASEEIANIDIARLILKAFDRSERHIEYVTDRPGHDRRYAIDSRRIREELGWKPQYNFKTAFRKTVAWYLKNQKWLKNIQKKSAALNPHIKKAQ